MQHADCDYELHEQMTSNTKMTTTIAKLFVDMSCPAWNLFKFLQFASQVGITRFSLRGVGFVWFATMLGKYNKLPLWMECVQRWYCYEGELVSLGVRFIIMHVPDGMSKIGQMKSNLAFLYILND